MLQNLFNLITIINFIVIIYFLFIKNKFTFNYYDGYLEIWQKLYKGYSERLYIIKIWFSTSKQE